ncbi:MAG: ABC transporter ATP-binding protein [Clostridia bacterium]|nr:ABC transporter ATP-binding protein [Clostridia bacterium]
MEQLRCENVTLGYENGAIVKGLSFSVEEGDYLAIVGENGSGKSTLMKTILGLIKPLGGKIERGDGLKRWDVGYLPQQTLVQRDFPASVLEVVLSGTLSGEKFHPFYTWTDRALAWTNIVRMGLTELKNRSYRELSGGQQQRVLLARALCATRKIILLDEPVTGLDPKVTLEMYELIRSLNREGVTIIMISHDVSAAVKYANKILHIGAHVFFGSVKEYLATAEGKLFTGKEE